MNGTITYLGLEEDISFFGYHQGHGRDWAEIRFDRVRIPQILHLLMIQGLPPASVFAGEMRVQGKTVDLVDWRLAKCQVPKKWQVPFYLRDVLLVKGETPQLTLKACIEVHRG